MPLRPQSRGISQYGIALPMILLFLLIITIAASFSIRRSTLNEGITRNQLDYEVGRQAAEAALRDAERDIYLQRKTGDKPDGARCPRNDDRPLTGRTGVPYFDADCPRGQCQFHTTYYQASDYAADPPVNPQPWWPVAKGGQWTELPNGVPDNCTFKGGIPLGTFTGTPDIVGVARQPEYILEYIKRGPDNSYIRITARGFGADINTEVVLQTYFRPPSLR